MATDQTERYLVLGVATLMLVAVGAALAFTSNTLGPGSNENRPPIAKIAPTDLTVNLGDSVEFSAANSSDPEGKALTYSWNFGDGSTNTGAIVTHTFQITGAFRVRVEVADDKGATNGTATNVWVDLNQPIPLGTATWTKQPPSSTPANIVFPVDPNATRATFHLELNTSTPSGAKAVVSVLDANGASVFETNTTLDFGPAKVPLDFSLNAQNLTTFGQWTLRIQALPVNTFQVGAAVEFTGTLRVEYKPA